MYEQSNDIFDESVSKIVERNINILDEYKKVDEISIYSLNALLYYLGMPFDSNDKIGIENRLSQIRALRPIPNKRKRLGYLLLLFNIGF